MKRGPHVPRSHLDSWPLLLIHLLGEKVGTMEKTIVRRRGTRPKEAGAEDLVFRPQETSWPRGDTSFILCAFRWKDSSRGLRSSRDI